MTQSITHIRNVAIIAHIDHGKTTLLDAILRQSGVFRENEAMTERVMDSNDLERERGITIYSKHTSVIFGDTKINIVDTPGHADFAGEVERVLNMVNGVLLLVDASEGPMPQTRFVLRKAMELHLKPIVVINKVDRPTARLSEVHDEVLDLFIELGADESQIDFPYVYASAISGFAKRRPEDEEKDLAPLFQMIVDHIPPPVGDPDAPFLMPVATLEYNDYLGKMACGRIMKGSISTGSPVVRLWTSAGRVDTILPYGGDAHLVSSAAEAVGEVHRATGRLTKLFGYQGLKRVEVESASAGDIVLFAGLDEVNIGDTIGAPDTVDAIPFVEIDQPTLSVNFMANDSPLAGRDGKHVTIRKIRERLERELKTNVSLLVEENATAESLKVSGRGELHLAILIETMRREGYEMQISRPRVITRNVGGVVQEPIEFVRLDLQEEYVGTMMEELSQRRGELLNMVNNGAGLVRLEFEVPTRGLIGLRSLVLNSTRGTGLLSHQFERYDAWRGALPDRSRGVLVAMETAKSTGYAIFNLQERAAFFIGAGEDCYEGMIVGENSRPDDMIVNIGRAKKLTNMRAAGSDENIVLTPPKRLTLEQCLAFIADDELIEVTPQNIRLRKRHLKREQRDIAKKTERAGAEV